MLAIFKGSVLVMRRRRLFSIDQDKQAPPTNNSGHDICKSLLQARQMPPIKMAIKPQRELIVTFSLKTSHANKEVKTISRLSAKETDDAGTMLIAVINKIGGNDEPKKLTVISKGSSPLLKAGDLVLLLNILLRTIITIKPAAEPNIKRADHVIGLVLLSNILAIGNPKAKRKAAPSA